MKPVRTPARQEKTVASKAPTCVQDEDEEHAEEEEESGSEDSTEISTPPKQGNFIFLYYLFNFKFKSNLIKKINFLIYCYISYIF